MLDPSLSLRLGQEIRRRRNATGLSVTELARHCCLTANYLSELETGTRGRNPSIGILFAIAQGLKVDIADLFGAKYKGLSAVGREAGQLVDTIPPAVQEGLLCLIRALSLHSAQKTPRRKS